MIPWPPGSLLRQWCEATFGGWSWAFFHGSFHQWIKCRNVCNWSLLWSGMMLPTLTRWGFRNTLEKRGWKIPFPDLCINPVHPLHDSFLTLPIFFSFYSTNSLFGDVWYFVLPLLWNLFVAISRVGFTCLILLCSWGNVGRNGAIKSLHFMEWYKHVFSWIDDTEYKTLLICSSP